MIWLRYVDDVFSIWPEDCDFNSFFSRLNSLHPCIKFKVEWEKHGRLPFLDVLIHKESSGLHFSVYRKATNSNAYIHYYSFHDKRIKKAVISGMFLRAYRICNSDKLQDEIEHIQGIFTELRYPEWFIHDAHISARKTFFKKGNTTREPPRKCLVVPYNEGFRGFKKVCQQESVGVAFTYPNTISKTLIKNKPKTEENVVVYTMPCKTCPQKAYVGETGRNLEKRKYEHRRDIRVGNEKSALFCHVRDQQHVFDFDQAKIVFRSNDYLKRRIVESALISSTPNVNLSQGHFAFNKVIAGIIKARYCR